MIMRNEQHDLFKDSEFYLMEDGAEEAGCDFCDGIATYQTEGSDDYLYYACGKCIVDNNLPVEGRT